LPLIKDRRLASLTPDKLLDQLIGAVQAAEAIKSIGVFTKKNTRKIPENYFKESGRRGHLIITKEWKDAILKEIQGKILALKAEVISHISE